jgi:type IV pilus assembly protein PilP
MRRGTIFVVALCLVAACSAPEDPGTAPKVSDFERERAHLSAKLKGQARRLTGSTRRNDATRSKEDETEFSAVDKQYTYDPTGKRDPFRSFILQTQKDHDDVRGPLEQFDLAQLEVVAVVWGTEKPRALVSDPSGRGYIVKEGTYMGKNDGRVITIADNALVVKETYVDYFGETTSKDVTMRVRADQEGNLR